MPKEEHDGATNLDDGGLAPETDERLMLAYGRRETGAFDAIFARHKQAVFGFFRRRVADATLAEELTQETFIAILRAIHHYQPTAAFRTYLYTIAYKILRSYRRKAFFRSGFTGGSAPGEEPSSNPSLEIEILMREALRKLDRDDREIVLLREFEQLSYAEIANLLHIPVNTVRSRLFRARTALREILTRQPARMVSARLSTTKEQA